MAAANNNTRKIALNGIMGALCVVSVFLASVLPTNRISFYALSSFFIAVIIIESGIKFGLLFYVGTSLISLIVVPDKLNLIPYVIFFGLYGAVKFYIEKINNIAIEFLIKLVYFNICVGVAYFFIKQVFTESLTSKLPWIVILIAVEIIFILYDYVYTRVIQYYNEKLRRLLKIR